MNSKKVSVIIPSFNRYNYLLNAINSIHNQTHENYEIIVVNDGSTEDGYYSSELKSFSKVIHIDRKDTPDWGGSRPAVRNYGISEAKGDLIAFLDDDDLWLPNKLELQLSEMNNNNIKDANYIDYGLLGMHNEFLKANIKFLQINESLKYFQEKLSLLNLIKPYLVKRRFYEIGTPSSYKYFNEMYLNGDLNKVISPNKNET